MQNRPAIGTETLGETWKHLCAPPTPTHAPQDRSPKLLCYPGIHASKTTPVPHHDADNQPSWHIILTIIGWVLHCPVASVSQFPEIIQLPCKLWAHTVAERGGELALLTFI